MKIFVTGVNGQLGHDVMNEMAKRGLTGTGSDITEQYGGVQDDSAVCTMPYVKLDITDADAVAQTIEKIQPDAVIHCAAWTAVDMAEDDDKSEKVRAVNAGGTKNIAEACKKLGIKMMYISTDYVFGGDLYNTPCKESQRGRPTGVYGKTKLDGELVTSENFSSMGEVCNAMESNTRGLNEYLENEKGEER